MNTGTAALLVKVTDVEDQPPEFVVASPVTRVSEDAHIGSSVLQGKIYHNELCVHIVEPCIYLYLYLY